MLVAVWNSGHLVPAVVEAFDVLVAGQNIDRALPVAQEGAVADMADLTDHHGS